MNQPPAHMVIELEEKDVREDLPKIVNAMSKMRAETVRDRELTDAQKDEYLHMAYRLASGIQAVADETMIGRMQVVADRLTKNPLLLRYDPKQDGHWKKQEKRFTESLEDLLITVVRDDFHSIDAKHHVLQAVKYLGVEDVSFKEREAVYDTIMPFHRAVPVQSSGFWRSLAGTLFGETYRVETVDNLILNVQGSSNGIEGLIERASELGYHELRLIMGDDQFKELREKMPEVRMVEEIPQRESKHRLRKFLAKTVKYTCPISLPMLGFLSENRIKHILDYLEPDLNWLQRKKSRDNVEEAIMLGNLGLEIVGGIIAALVYEDPLLKITGFYFAAEAIGRLAYVVNTDRAPGSLTGLPIEAFLSLVGGKKIKGVPCNVAIPLENRTNGIGYVPNPTSYYDRIARLEVPEDVEQSLLYSMENHHAYGKPFVAFVNEQVGEKPRVQVSEHVDRESQSVSYNHELPVDGFTKNSSLYCFNRRRYLVTTIGRNNGNGFVEDTGLVLASDKPLHEKLSQIGKQANARYIHLKAYQNGEVANDMEASG